MMRYSDEVMEHLADPRVQAEALKHLEKAVENWKDPRGESTCVDVDAVASVLDQIATLRSRAAELEVDCQFYESERDRIRDVLSLLDQPARMVSASTGDGGFDCACCGNKPCSADCNVLRLIALAVRFAETAEAVDSSPTWAETKDTEITCVFCGADHCDVETRHRKGGRTLWSGAHKECIPKFNGEALKQGVKREKEGT